MPDMNSTSRNQENGGIIVTIMQMLRCMPFNIERHIYLSFVAMLSFHPPVSLIRVLAGTRRLIEISCGL